MANQKQEHSKDRQVIDHLLERLSSNELQLVRTNLEEERLSGLLQQLVSIPHQPNTTDQDALLQVVSTIRELYDSEMVVLYLYDGRVFFSPNYVSTKTKTEAVASEVKTPRPRGLTYQITNERVLVVTDIDKPEFSYISPQTKRFLRSNNLSAFIGIHLQDQNSTLGILYINFQNELPNHYIASHLLERIRDTVSRVVNLIRDTNLELSLSSLLIESSNSIFGALAENELFDQVIESITLLCGQISPVDTTSLVKWSAFDRRGEIIITTLPELDDPYIPMDNNPSYQLLVQAISKNEPYLIIEDVERESTAWGDVAQQWMHRGIKSLAIFPIYVNEELYASIGIDYHDYIQLSNYSVLLRYCQVLANQAGLALEKLHQQVELAMVEQRIASTNVLASYGDMASNLHHYLKGKMAIIKGLTVEILQEMGEDADEYLKEDVSLISDTADEAHDELMRLYSQLEEATDPSRFTDPVDIQEVIKQVVQRPTIRIQTRNAKIDLDTNFPAIRKSLRVNIPFLYDVIYNLLQNAIDSIVFSEKTIKKPSIEIELVEIESGYLISVIDNGAGIAEDLRSNIFKRGFSTKSDKAVREGMGLWWSQLYLRRFGIDLDFTVSEKQVTFNFIIPKHLMFE